MKRTALLSLELKSCMQQVGNELHVDCPAQASACEVAEFLAGIWFRIIKAFAVQTIATMRMLQLCACQSEHSVQNFIRPQCHA